ncbi:MAG: lipid A deacylase LpxR family protein [Pseudomonadaceae bacterium]|nr:lipid A deacylase LpxR family protein [Pseudomonadaceae bacterium]
MMFRLAFTLLWLSVAVQAREQILTLSSENDFYTNSGDAYYTNGARAAWLDADFEPPWFADWLVQRMPLMDATAPMLVQYSIGQNLYTPSDITIATPQPHDRPWAAHLYATMGITEGTRDEVNDLELSVGWVGPGALGEPTQKLVHGWVNARTPQGWDNQLKDEPAINIAFQRRWPTWAGVTLADSRVTLAPHVGAALGNVDTHAAAGLTLRWDSDKDAVVDNPVRVRPSLPGTGYFQSPSHPVLTWFTGLEMRGVARNLFLDGNTFADGPHVDKKNLVADVQAGFLLTYKRAQFGYTAVYRTPEFHGQKRGQVFGAITVGVKF